MASTAPRVERVLGGFHMLEFGVGE
jgi:hypothetical protein